MDLNIQIPDNTASIFEYLQKGLFISSNSTSEEVRDMYNEIDENYESLYQYFLQINYTLERGNEYFFFSRIGKHSASCVFFSPLFLPTFVASL